jgi:hypothetical protein
MKTGTFLIGLQQTIMFFFIFQCLDFCSRNYKIYYSSRLRLSRFEMLNFNEVRRANTLTEMSTRNIPGGKGRPAGA